MGGLAQFAPVGAFIPRNMQGHGGCGAGQLLDHAAVLPLVKHMAGFDLARKTRKPRAASAHQGFVVLFFTNTWPAAATSWCRNPRAAYNFRISINRFAVLRMDNSCFQTQNCNTSRQYDCCAAGYNLRWLLRAIARLDIGPAFLVGHAKFVFQKQHRPVESIQARKLTLASVCLTRCVVSGSASAKRRGVRVTVPCHDHR